MGMDNCSCLNISLCFILFCNKPGKQIMMYVCLQLNLLPPPIRPGTLSARPSLPLSERTYFMDDLFLDEARV